MHSLLSLSEKKMKKISAFMIAGLLCFSMLYVFSQEAKATGELWWNYNWLARRPIEINSSDAQDLTEYSIMLSIAYDNDMRGDFGDLRFIYHDQVSDTYIELAYWIQEENDGVSAIIWVKIPVIKAGLTMTIYMYYNNPSVTTTSSGKNTFWFFDDFNNGDYVSDGWWAWNFAGTGGQWVESDTVVKQIGNNPGDTVLSHNIPQITDYEMQVRARPDHWTEDAVFVGTGNYSAGPGTGQEMAVGIDWGYLGVPGRYWGITNTTGEGGPIGAWTSIERPINLEWYTFKLAANGTSNGWVSDSSGTYYVGSPNCAAPTIKGVHFKANPMQKYASCDWVFVRKYACPEPSYVIGSEESVVAPPPISISIIPLSASILVGQTVAFTSIVSGGYAPYGYQWYLNDAPIPGATSASWTFTPATSGIYYVYLRITDAKGNTTQSETGRITVATVPVGGYSFPIQVQIKTKPIIPYIALTASLTAIFIKLKPKTKRKH